MIAGKTFTHLLRDGDEKDAGDRMADKRRNDLRVIWRSEDDGQRSTKEGPTRTMTDRTITTLYSERPSSMRWMAPSMVSMSPLDLTPFPSAIPPIAKNTMVHANCSKSSYEWVNQCQLRHHDPSHAPYLF